MTAMPDVVARSACDTSASPEEQGYRHAQGRPSRICGQVPQDRLRGPRRPGRRGPYVDIAVSLTPGMAPAQGSEPDGS